MTSEAPASRSSAARRRVVAMLGGDAASAALGMELVECGPGRGVLRMRVREDMVQGHGTCHGGLLFTLADTAFAVACNAAADGPVVGASADITWVAPAFAGDVLVAEAVEHTRYGRNGITDVTLVREVDRAVVARFRGRSVELTARPAPPQPALAEPDGEAPPPQPGGIGGQR